MRNRRNTDTFLMSHYFSKYEPFWIQSRAAQFSDIRSSWKKLSGQRTNRLSALDCWAHLRLFYREIDDPKSIWIKKFSAPLTVNGSLLKTSRHSSHFMKQDSSGNYNGSESSMTKWTKKRSTDGSSLIMFWTWRKGQKPNISSSDNYGIKTKYC